jgi:hypothetical protein
MAHGFFEEGGWIKGDHRLDHTGASPQTPKACGRRRKVLTGKFTPSIWSLANHRDRAFRRSIRLKPRLLVAVGVEPSGGHLWRSNRLQPRLQSKS